VTFLIVIGSFIVVILALAALYDYRAPAARVDDSD
jgi:hypothetical protein